MARPQATGSTGSGRDPAAAPSPRPARSGVCAPEPESRSLICLAQGKAITDTPAQFGRPIDPAETAEPVLRCFAQTRHRYLAHLTFPDIGRDCLGFTRASSTSWGDTH